MILIRMILSLSVIWLVVFLVAMTGFFSHIYIYTYILSGITGPDNPTCQLLPKDCERKAKVQAGKVRKKRNGD